jgi:Flp pilus assembly protein TadG
MNQGEHTMKTRNQKIGQKGVAVLELSIILPFFVLLVFGTIEFGVMFYNKQVITNASREGARAGITGANQATIKNIVDAYCANKLINLNGNNQLQADDIVVSGPDVNNDLTVDVSFTNTFLLAQIIGFTDTTLSARTIMRMEPGSGT